MPRGIPGGHTSTAVIITYSAGHNGQVRGVDNMKVGSSSLVGRRENGDGGGGCCFHVRADQPALNDLAIKLMSVQRNNVLLNYIMS